MKNEGGSIVSIDDRLPQMPLILFIIEMTIQYSVFVMVTRYCCVTTTEDIVADVLAIDDWLYGDDLWRASILTGPIRHYSWYGRHYI